MEEKKLEQVIRHAIYLSRFKPEETFKAGCNLINFTISLLEKSIREKNPNLSEEEIIERMRHILMLREEYEKDRGRS